MKAMVAGLTTAAESRQAAKDLRASIVNAAGAETYPITAFT
ncbi:MAG: hypothetical protein ACXVZV_04195 [Terriglobales bacterium]